MEAKVQRNLGNVVLLATGQSKGMDLRASRLMTRIELEQVTAFLSSVYYCNERELLLLLFAGESMICNGFISHGRVLPSFTGSVGFGV